MNVRLGSTTAWSPKGVTIPWDPLYVQGKTHNSVKCDMVDVAHVELLSQIYEQ